MSLYLRAALPSGLEPFLFKHLVRARLVEEAISVARDMLSKTVQPGWRVRLAYALSAAGRYSDALREYETLLASDPGNKTYEQNVLQTLMELDNVVRIRELSEFALQRDPTNGFAQKCYIYAVKEADEPAAVDRAVREALARFPDNFEVIRMAGIAFRECNRDAEAIELFEKCHSLRPRLANPLIQLGETLEQSGQIRQANEKFEEAVRLAPHDSHAILHLSSTQVQLGKLADAKKNLERISDNDVRRFNAFISRAYIEIALGNLRDAEILLHKAIEIDPLEPLLVALCHLLLSNDRFVDAAAVLSRITGSYDAAMLSGVYFAGIDSLEAARKQFQIAIEIAPEDWICAYNLALTEMWLGDHAEAVIHFRRARQKNSMKRDPILGELLALLKAERYGEALNAARALDEATVLRDLDLLVLDAYAELAIAGPGKDDFLAERCVALCGEAMKLLLLRPLGDVRLALESQILDLRGRALVQLRRYGEAQIDLNRVRDILLLLGQPSINARLNAERLQRVRKEDVSGMPPTTGLAAIGFALDVFGAVALALHWLSEGAFVSTEILGTLFIPLAYYLPSITKLKVPGVEFEKAFVTNVYLDIEQSIRLLPFDPHGNMIRLPAVSLERGVSYQSPERVTVKEAKLWGALPRQAL